MYPAPDSVLSTPCSLRFHPLCFQYVVNQKRIIQELHRLHLEDGIEFKDILVGHPPNDHQPAVASERAYVNPSAFVIRCLE